jgi:adenine-specific DNA-methyltransferase
MAKNKPAATKVESIRHKDKRKNIPTEELRDFVRDDEHSPKTMLYPRDPSLDPQLVWKGKDDQDRADLAVPVVPIYIQEKIHPQAIIDALPRLTPEARQPDLFADFNGLPEDFGQRVEFYKHDGHWSNRMILGDSLLVMTSLAEKEGLKGKVQTIYMDPPYGIKFGSNWQVSTRKRDVKDGKAEDATRQPEQVRAFRDTWQLGIHSYLAYLRDRLVAARELLTESGSIFVQIGDEMVHLVRCVMDEVFGSENDCGLVTFKKTIGAGSFAGGTNVLSSVCDYLLWYANDKENVKYPQLYISKEVGGQGAEQYAWLELPSGQRCRLSSDQIPARSAEGRLFRGDNLTSQTTRVGQTTVFPVELDGRTFIPVKGGWKTNQEGMRRLKASRRLLGQGNTLSYVRYLDDFPCFPFINVWDDTVTSGFGEAKTYVVQTNAKVIERCLLMTTDPV